MEHSIYHLFKGYELSFIMRVPEAKADLLTFVPIKAQKILLWWPEFC